jgi:hypothetical protein
MTATPERFEECKIYEADAALRLAEMGLRVAYFDSAVRKGHDRASRVLPVHPKTYGGQIMWAETLGELRTQVLNLNSWWRLGQTGNYETAYNPERAIAIAVVGGNTDTGERTFHHPKAARKRGPITEKRVRRNAIGQMMFDLPEFKEKPPAEDENCDTWFFLLNARKGLIYSELSLPLSLGADSRIGAWRERIIMPSISFEGAVVTPVEPDENEPPQVHVGRK